MIVKAGEIIRGIKKIDAELEMCKIPESDELLAGEAAALYSLIDRNGKGELNIYNAILTAHNYGYAKGVRKHANNFTGQSDEPTI